MSDQPDLRLFFEPGRNTVSPTQNKFYYGSSEIAQFVKETLPCVAARHWLEDKQFTTLAQAWDACQRVDWMLWAISNHPKDFIRRKATKKLRATVMKDFYMKPEGVHLIYMKPDNTIITPAMIREALAYNPFEV